jgi:hypothetical protein
MHIVRNTEPLVYEFHEIANIFPLLEGKEYIDLIADIKRQGLLEVITLFDGKILDGRNRYQACLAAHVEPRFEQLLKSDDPIAFVISKNLRRRQLNSDELAFAAQELANLRWGYQLNRRTKDETPDGVSALSIDAAAAKFEISQRRVERARAVAKHPDLKAKVLDKEMSMNQADQIARDRTRAERNDAEIQKEPRRKKLRTLTWTPVTPTDRELAAWVRTYCTWERKSRGQAMQIIYNTPYWRGPDE